MTTNSFARTACVGGATAQYRTTTFNGNFRQSVVQALPAALRMWTAALRTVVIDWKRRETIYNTMGGDESIRAPEVTPRAPQVIPCAPKVTILRDVARTRTCDHRPSRKTERGRVLRELTRITDVHIHIQPWRALKPKVQEAMRKGKEDHWEFLIALMDDPRALLDVMDKSGVWRVGLVNYPSPDIMGFDDSTNTFAAKYAQANPERLIPYGGVHARFTKDPGGDVDRLIDLGIRLIKIHPPHQAFPANAYTNGLSALGKIYRRCEERGLPVMVHTGTSIFPGARSKYGNPMELDDVAIDFPDLRLVMAHGGRPLYMEEAFFILRRHRTVRLDVSGIPPSKLLEYFPRLTEIGDRVLWGTDWPSPGVKDLRQNIDQFLALPLTPEQQQAILETNALALFPMESRTHA